MITIIPVINLFITSHTHHFCVSSSDLLLNHVRFQKSIECITLLLTLQVSSMKRPVGQHFLEHDGAD